MTQKPRTADYTKEYNRKAVLSMLRRSSMSRAELARATGLSRAATSLIAEELLKDGIVMELPPQFDRWHGVEISAILSQALDLPAYLEHDVCALALHQLEMGHSRNFMLVFVDIGIGAAIMSGGELVGNSRYFTGEVGHTTIRFDGRQCACGNRGCLETYASIPALLEGSSFSSWRELADSAEQSPEAQRLVYQEALYLSAGLINLLNLIPVDTIYLSGDVCYRYELLAAHLRQEISAKALFGSTDSIRIYPSSQDPNVGTLSAADVVFDKFFRI